jgi:hypothetical protein
MNRIFTIADLDLRAGQEFVAHQLRDAGFEPVSFWQKLMQRIPRHERRWRLENPRVSCLDEELEIYPCLDGYLDPDRRWQTECTLLVQEKRIERVVVEVIDGVYAAGNFFERFVKTATDKLGKPLAVDRTRARWQLAGAEIQALYDRHQYRAEFSLVEANVAAMSGAD